MRVASVEITGFRAFSGTERFDLNGDVVLVVGVNGQGKTSLFDAILWAITGQIARLNSPKSIVSLYSASGEARVEVRLTSDTHSELVVIRRSDGETNTLLVRNETDTFHGEAAEFELIQRLWRAGLAANEPRNALKSALERGVYLQQDMITDFLTADTDQQRFNAIGELMGTGRATELQLNLERSRVAWSRITNERKSDAGAIEARLRRLQGRLQELADTEPRVALNSEDWVTWWTQAKSYGISRQTNPTIDSSDAQAAVDLAMAELQALRLSHQRREVRLQEMTSTMQDLPPTTIDLGVLQGSLSEASIALTIAQEELQQAEEKAAQVHRRQLQRRSEQQELRVLAEVALRHLSDKCPVCQQTYDQEATRQRLQILIRSTGDAEESQESTPNLPAIAERVRLADSRTTTAAEALQDGRHQVARRTNLQNHIRESLAELSIDEAGETILGNVIQSALQENYEILQGIFATILRGESIALSLAWAGQLARRVELEREVLSLERDLATAQEEVQARGETRDLVSRIIDGLRTASSKLVESELGKIGPLLQRIYSTADPHPGFQVVNIVSRMHRGRGQVLAEMKDPVRGLRIDKPSSFLSSSQMNVLAVSIFLALNLGTPSLPLRAAILDDPLQSLDDLNLLGLIDLLRRMRERRQLLIATHDSRFASLLERKLRPVSGSHRTIVLELSGWSRAGPIANARDVAQDRDPIRIAAA